MAGSDDSLVRTPNQHALHPLIRHSELKMFPGARHMLVLERPAEVRLNRRNIPHAPMTSDAATRMPGPEAGADRSGGIITVRAALRLPC